MNRTVWPHRPPPGPGRGATTVGRWELHAAPDLTRARRYLHRQVTGAGRPPGADDDDVDRLLLAFEELASNGLRHGGPPVRVEVTSDASDWLIDVTDAATDRPPAPAVDRDPALGGLGLHLVARLCSAHGWCIQQDRKHVWARIGVAARS